MIFSNVYIMKLVKNSLSHLAFSRNSALKTFSFAALLIFSFPAFSVQKTLLIGGEKGWKNIKEMDGLAFGKGKFGYDSIELSTSNQKVNDFTDMFISFDDGNFSDKAGNYNVVSNSLIPSDEAVKGNGAALSRGNGEGLALKGNEKSLFGTEGIAGSFTFDFWLCPAVSENGETVFSWRTSLNNRTTIDYQMITALINKNHLVWTFANFFSGYSSDNVFIEGRTNLVPRQWSRHTVSFDEETGVLEYLVNGRLENLIYVTSNGHESGNIFNPRVGKNSMIEFCSSYTGKIDDIRILKYPYSYEIEDVLSTGTEKYKADGGRFTTEPVLVSHSASMTELQAVMNIPSQTDVKFYVRSGDNCYGWTDTYPEWREVSAGEPISNVSGLYFQVSAELLPDGGAEKTPSITEITVKYNEQDEPLPPFTVQAEPGNSSVTVTWSYSVDDSAGGYLVYYGNRPGEYLGRAALEGDSPVKAGNKTSLTLNGLQNGKIYYFAVAAYSKIDGRIIGTLSKEVYARPSSRLTKK